MLDLTIGFILRRGGENAISRDTLSQLRAHSAKAIREFNEGDFSVDEQILDIVHQTAKEMTAAKDGEMVKYGPAASTDRGDSLIDRYGFSSIDTLHFVLILEDKFGITLADEDLSQEVLSSASALAKHIGALLTITPLASASTA